MRPTAVIIPSRDAALLSRALSSLSGLVCIKSSEIRVFIVDDGVKSRPQSALDLTYLQGSAPFCFARNINLGIRAAGPDCDVFLMNDDVVLFSSDALEVLSKPFSLNADIGIVSPVFTRFERVAAQRFGNHPWGYRGFVSDNCKTLSFAAVLIRREVIDRVGLLDEMFTGYGFDDNDYCLRTRLAGFQIGVLPSVVANHGDTTGQASCTFRQSRDFASMIEINRKLFVSKWGKRLLALDDSQCTLLSLIAESL